MTDRHYKLLVIDIDGTLTNRYGEISVPNREALALVRSSGVKVSLSTGRTLKAGTHILNRLSLDGYHIFFDGALVSGADPTVQIYAQHIERTVVRLMVEFARSHDIDLELHTVTHYFAERETWSTDAHRRFFNDEPIIRSFDGLWERERIIKGGITVTTSQEETGAKTFGDHFGDSLHLSRAKIPLCPDVTFVNILAPGVSKGTALEALASHLEVPLAGVVAVGDGQNDIPLLAKAGLAIAMGNAREELKKIADHVTLDVEKDGLAAAIKQFLL